MEMTSGNCGVTILGRSGMTYREGKKTSSFDGEMQVGTADFIVYSSSIQVWDDGQPISSAEKAQILSNLELVFKNNGLRLAIGP